MFKDKRQYLFVTFIFISSLVCAATSDEQKLQQMQQEIDNLQKQVERLKEEQAQTNMFRSSSEIDKQKSAKPQSTYGMEKCQVVDDHGNGLIKPYMADSGNNLEGDREAWIWVPHGQCKRINKGDFTGVSEEIKYKIHSSNLVPSQTSK